MKHWHFPVPFAAGVVTGIIAAALMIPAVAAEAIPSQTTPPDSPVRTTDESDLRAGDNAFAQKDYPVAVSFYTKYLQNAEKRKDKSAVKTA